jgi:hypothetical protein
MSEPDIRDAETVEDPAAHAALPSPPTFRAGRYAAPPAPGLFDRLLTWIEGRPLAAALALFAILALLHLMLLNLAGVANGVFIGDAFVLSAPSTAIEILLLAFIAYNVVLPTLFARACLRAYDKLRPVLALDDYSFGQTRAVLLDPHYLTRLGAGFFWAILLTPVFGSLLRGAVPGEGSTAALLTIWMYVRIALTFGLLGANIGYIVMLHHRLRALTGTHLRVDLFDMTALEPIARYARRVALYLIVLLALAGPAVAQPDAMYASAALLAAGVVLTATAVIGAMWGARRAIRAAKKVAIDELQVYARELWRRAYANNHIAEAVAIPALGAMLTVRNEIQRLSDWPGGWGVFARLATLIVIPIASWFGGQLAAQFIAALPS